MCSCCPHISSSVSMTCWSWIPAFPQDLRHSKTLFSLVQKCIFTHVSSLTLQPREMILNSISPFIVLVSTGFLQQSLWIYRQHWWRQVFKYGELSLLQMLFLIPKDRFYISGHLETQAHISAGSSGASINQGAVTATDLQKSYFTGFTPFPGHWTQNLIAWELSGLLLNNITFPSKQRLTNLLRLDLNLWFSSLSFPSIWDCRPGGTGIWRAYMSTTWSLPVTADVTARDLVHFSM